MEAQVGELIKAEKVSMEAIANSMLIRSESDCGKPNYSNRDFMNAVIIFQAAMMDKMWDLQELEKMESIDRLNMCKDCGEELNRFIKTYTGLDTHKVDEFV